MLIYTTHITPRLQYIAELIFRELLEVEFEFTTSTDRYVSYTGPKINYTRTRLSDGVHIHPHALLFEREIRQQRIDTGKYENKTTLFYHHNTSDLPYDPLAAAFFLVVRYEEYLPFKVDSYGRFRGEKSFAYAKGFHTEPLVNHYALHIKELLQQRYPDMRFSSKEYQFILTFDIDNAFKYIDKGFFRSIGAMGLAILKRNWSFIAERRKVLSGEEKDPNDTFDEQLRLSEKYQVYPVYFFPMGNYGKMDKNIAWSSLKLKELIKKVSDRFMIGIHPSYASNNHPQRLEMEIARFNAISGKTAARSRQHYLKLSFPHTYRLLLSQGVQEDWSLGHASILGFRASIAAPFYFYDLEKEEQTNLRIFPFGAMDSTLMYYQKLSPQTAFEELKQVVNEVKKVSGTFIFVAHNDLIGKKSVWQGWNNYFEQFIAYARE